DFEATFHNYRLGGPGGFLVQSYWSDQATRSDGNKGAFVVPDGTTQNFFVKPVGELILNTDQSVSTITIDTFTDPNGGTGVKVTVNEDQTAQFDGGQITKITVNPGPGTHYISVNKMSVPVTINSTSSSDTVLVGVNNNDDTSAIQAKIT